MRMLKNGRTPLVAVIFGGNAAAIALLLKAGADVNIPDSVRACALAVQLTAGHAQHVNKKTIRKVHPEASLAYIGWDYPAMLCQP